MRKTNQNIGKKVAIVLAILFLFTLSLYSSEISLSSKIDKTDIAFEESIELTVELKWIGNILDYRFELQPLIEADNLIVVGSNRAISSGEEAGQEITTRTFKFSLKPTLSGASIIYPVVFKYISMPDSIPGELSTQDYKILIANPVPVVKDSGVSTNFILISFGLLIVISTVVIVILRRKKNEPTEPVKCSEDTFLEELSIIKKESQSDRRQFYARLHRQLILYLETKYGLNISGKTNQAILVMFNDLEIPIEHKEKLSGYISTSEKEKYAPTKGEPGEIIKLITELEIYFTEIKN